ncbi:MAG: hypothetical protein ACREEL_11520 [Stellaceae bacterium]
MTEPQKTRINTTFISIDGKKGTRSKMEDARSVRSRVWARLEKTDKDSALLPGINAYNQGDYEIALSIFLGSAADIPACEEEIRPHIIICKRVVHSVLSPTDIEYRRACSKWEQLLIFAKWVKKSPPLKLRCKYCGHYTEYIDPDAGVAYLGLNNCENCGRGYPMPDFAWDGIDGQAYIYYRNSVREPEFYQEFEKQFDVEIDHRVFLGTPPVKLPQSEM